MDDCTSQKDMEMWGLCCLEWLQYGAKAVQQDEEKVWRQSLREELSKMEEKMTGVEKWINLIKEYSVPKDLKAPLLNAMIEKSSFTKQQRMRIWKNRYTTDLLEKQTDNEGLYL